MTSLLLDERRALVWALKHPEEFSDDPIAMAFLEKIKQAIKND